jgi:pectate lyase
MKTKNSTSFVRSIGTKLCLSIFVTILTMIQFVHAQSMIGYATVSGDGYTTTTGGTGGTATTVSTLADLQTFAASCEDNTTPKILYISGKISSSSSTVITIKHGANISIYGIGSTSELQNVGLNIWDYQNVIIRNLKIHEVFYPDDALTIAACQHVWIDHNELYSKMGTGITVDTYDGLLDIKKGSRYVTVSWNYLHDHMKCSLIGHTDNTSQQAEDSQMRITFHHNYFYNTDGRNPSLRFGAVHMFNNYFKTISDYGIAARDGGHAKLENNVYEDVNIPMTTDKFPVSGLPNGYICESGNLLTGTTGAKVISQTGCDFWTSTTLPYSYTLDAVSSVTTTVPAGVGVGKVSNLQSTPDVTALSTNKTTIEKNSLEQNYPNPVEGYSFITFNLAQQSNVEVIVFDYVGKKVAVVTSQSYDAGTHTTRFVPGNLKSGLYFYTLFVNGQQADSKKLIMQ